MSYASKSMKTIKSSCKFIQRIVLNKFCLYMSPDSFIQVTYTIHICHSDSFRSKQESLCTDFKTIKKGLVIILFFLCHDNFLFYFWWIFIQNNCTIWLKIDGDGAALVKNLALQALGIFSILDIELAKEHFMMFCFNVSNSEKR